MEQSRLVAGMPVMVQGLLGPVCALVTEVDDRKATAESPKSLWHLLYAPDSRGGWICTCGGSKSVLKLRFDEAREQSYRDGSRLLAMQAAAREIEAERDRLRVELQAAQALLDHPGHKVMQAAIEGKPLEYNYAGNWKDWNLFVKYFDDVLNGNVRVKHGNH